MKIIKMILIVSLLAILIIGYNSYSNADDEVQVSSYESVMKAVKEMATAYYDRGTNIQYNCCKAKPHQSPEEATSQNIVYMVCSHFVRSVYQQLLGVMIPNGTGPLVGYTRRNKGTANAGVLAYGKASSDKKSLTMSFYDPVTGELQETIQNPTLMDMLPYIKEGDVLTYTGHVVLIYELIRDNNGNVVDAYIIQSGGGVGGAHITTKSMVSPDSSKWTFDDITTTNSYLYLSKVPNAYKEGARLVDQGSINIMKMSEKFDWGRFNVTKEDGEYPDETFVHPTSGSRINIRDEYSFLRFIQEDENGNAYLTLNANDLSIDDEYSDLIEQYSNGIYLSMEARNRISHSRLYVEKTVNVWDNDATIAGINLIYTITVKNNSDTTYKSDVRVVEYVPEYTQFLNYNDELEYYSNTEIK